MEVNEPIGGTWRMLRSSHEWTKSDAWAAGNYINPTTRAHETLVAHWNGTGWSTVASPDPGGTTANDFSVLIGVKAYSPTDVLAVGYYSKPKTDANMTLALQWDGSRWLRV